MQTLKKHWSGTLVVLLLGAATLLGLKAQHLSKNARQMKEDLVELSSIKYGLFNVDEWKRILSEIVAKKIDDLEVTDENREEIGRKVSELLYSMLNRFEAEMKEDSNRSLLGWWQSAKYSFLKVFKKLREKVPQMTEEVINFLENDDKREELKAFVRRKMDEYADSTFAETDYTEHNAIIAHYGYTDREATLNALPVEYENLRKPIKSIQTAIIALALVVFVLLLLPRPYENWVYTAFSLFALVLLALGLSMPMLDIDARIASLRFTLLGEEVEFLDQVLYFKSKSILEVVSLMMAQSQIEVILVGLLVFSFSVLFPLAKLASTNAYLHATQLRSNGIIRFLVFKTGKWSMADVMVVAIFMAYIGFSGIISEQLRQLEGFSKNLEVVTTDGSTLQAGFFFFLAFVIISILLGQKLDVQELKTSD